MSNIDVDIPEVQAMHKHARFFKEKGKDFVEISFVGMKDTVVKKVGPEHMAEFRNDWNAYCDGRPLERRQGTPLTEIPNVDERKAESYIQKNLHTAEEVAALSDGQCQNLGHGTLTDREASKKMLDSRRAQQDERARNMVAKLQADIGPRPAEKYAAQSDLTAISAKVDDLTENVAALVRALTEKKKPGRPKKVTNEPTDDN